MKFMIKRKCRELKKKKKFGVRYDGMERGLSM